MPISISQIVSMTPGVISGGGAASLLTGVILTQDASVAPGDPLVFYDDTDVATWFGAGADESVAASYYFPGIVNGKQLPYNLTFARYAATAAPAGSYGAVLGLTLGQLQALSGTLIVTTAALHTSATINLAAATSLTNVAALVTAGFTSPDFTVTYDTTRNRFTLLTTATGATVASSDISGTLAASLGLSAASGAYVQTVGVAADTAATAMARLLTVTTNWATFTHAWAAVLADRLAFAAWNSTQNYKFLYLGWDTDAIDLTASSASSFGLTVFDQPYQGTLPVYGTLVTAASFMGYAASIDFDLEDGRTNLAFRQFTAGTPATCSTLANAQALITNKYTYVGAYANAANSYTIAYPGAVSGNFLWIDTYLDQIHLNSELQRAAFEGLLAYGSIPYNSDGYGQLYSCMLDVIDAAVASGIIRAGVTLSNSQAQQVNAAAGRTIDTNLSSRGWYLLITDAADAASMRQNRTSPSIQFWYTDGGSIQALNIDSTTII